MSGPTRTVEEKKDSQPTLANEACPACGAQNVGGRAGCQALMDELSARAYNDLVYAATHDLAFDAYCMQHPDDYCRSAKSYAAHLTRLCCGIEQQGDDRIYAAIQEWLNGSVALVKPMVLARRGRMTIADVAAARASSEHSGRVHAWAQEVWNAYRSQHDLARLWIKFALLGKDERRFPK